MARKMVLRARSRRSFKLSESDKTNGGRFAPSKTPSCPAVEKPEDKDTTSRLSVFLICVITVFCVATAAAAFLRPWQVNLKAFKYGTTPALKGPLAANSLLSKADKLYSNQIKGPESVAFLDGHLYTGTADGKVLDIYEGAIRVLAKLGREPCGDVTHLMATKEAIDGETVMFLNDVAVTSEGVAFVSQSTTRWTRREFRYLGLENADDGRILKYDPTSGNVSSVCHGAYHANGVVLSRDESFLLVAESVRAQIIRCYIKGPNEGKVEVFADNLPGFPDNIRQSSSGGFWVALTGVRNASAVPPCWERYGEWPWVRLLVFRWQELVYLPWISNTVSWLTGSPPYKRGAKKTYGLILELDELGSIVRSLHDPTGVIVGLSHVEDVNGTLYLGSAFNSYIGKLNLTFL